jgi:hypothetical protein
MGVGFIDVMGFFSKAGFLAKSFSIDEKYE